MVNSFFDQMKSFLSLLALYPFYTVEFEMKQQLRKRLLKQRLIKRLHFVNHTLG